MVINNNISLLAELKEVDFSTFTQVNVPVKSSSNSWWMFEFSRTTIILMGWKSPLHVTFISNLFTSISISLWRKVYYFDSINIFHFSAESFFFSWVLLHFRNPSLFSLMILVRNFMLINNHAKTWVWKSAEAKLLTLKLL